MSKMSYTLYHHPYSICSIMVRYTLALRGPPRAGSPDVTVSEEGVDISGSLDQLTENYLCNINPKGQVPVLAGPSLSTPIADSEEIVYYLAKSFPSIIPEEQEPQVSQYMKRLHGINYFSLTFNGKPAAPQRPLAEIKKRLGDPNISERYRSALLYKLKVHEQQKIGGLETGVPEEQARIASELLAELAQLPRPAGSTGPWLYGREKPNGLDAALVAFIARMLDIGRGDIVPESLKAFADRAMATPEWEAVMQGRKTMMGQGGAVHMWTKAP